MRGEVRVRPRGRIKGVESPRSADLLVSRRPEVEMTRRFLATFLTAVIAFPFVAAAQAPPGAPPLGPDGHPDLQGVWLNNSATPLERPPALQGRPTLTDEEVAELRARAERLFKDTNADFAGGDAVFLAALANIDRFKSANATGTTFEMIEREFDNRTSLVIDPPDGRIPPLTAEAQQRRAAADEISRHPAAWPVRITDDQSQ